MATEANVLINIEGKPYRLNKHVKKSSLIEIITKLQADLTNFKEFTQNQINYKTELEKTQLENRKLQESLQKEINKKEKQDEINDDVNELDEHAKTRKRLKETYEKKANNAIQLYVEKIDLLEKRIIEIDKDRESYAEIIQTKQSTIKDLKTDTERLKKQQVDLEQHHNEAIASLKQKHEAEKQQMEHEKQNLIKEKEVLQKTYIDLDKIRKYLEKNNATLKNSLAETKRINDERIQKLSKDFEQKGSKHLEEVKKMRQNVETIVQEAEVKIERFEEKLAKTNEDYQSRISVVSEENADFKGVIRNFEQSEQTLKSEISMYRNLVEQTRSFYEDSIRSLNEKNCTEKDKIDQEMNTLKADYETRINELENGKEIIEGDTNQKAKKIAQLQTDNKYMSEKLVDLKLKADENNKRYVENYNILREKVETIKTNYETEKSDLKAQLDGRDKIIEDLNQEIKKLERQTKSLIYSNDLLKQENEKDIDKIWQKIQNQKESYTEELQKLKETHTKKMELINNDVQQVKLDYEVLDTHYNELLSSKQKVNKTCDNLREKLAHIEDENRQQISQLKKGFLLEENFLKQEFEKQNQELLNQREQAENFQNEVTKLRSTNQDLRDSIQHLNAENKKEIEHLANSLEDKSNKYKADLQNMKQILSYKEEIIKKLETKLNKHQTNYDRAVTEKQEEIQNLQTTNETVIQEIKANHEMQKQKYDILIYEFYKELKEQQNETDKLTAIKKSLEQENMDLKKRNGDIIVNITKQKEKFQNDSEFMKLLEYLLT